MKATRASRWTRCASLAAVMLVAAGALGTYAAPTAAAAPVVSGIIPDALVPDALDCKADAPFYAPTAGPTGVIDSGPVAAATATSKTPARPPATPAPGAVLTPGAPAVPTIPGQPLGPPVPPLLGPPAPAAPIAPAVPADATTVYQQYGMGGLVWIDYDPGCKPKISAGLIADLSLSGLSLVTSTSIAVTRYAFTPSTLALLDPIINLATKTFGNTLFLPLLPIAGVFLGVVIIFAGRRSGALSAALETAAYLVGMVCLAFACLLYPLALAPQVDAATTGAVASVGEALAGDTNGNPGASYADSLGSNLTQSVVYNTWCSGNVGRTTGKTAEEFCPRILAASTLTRAEYAAVIADPKALSGLKDQKANEYKAVAKDLLAADPVAYRYLAGNESAARVGYTVLGWATWLVSGLFALMGFLFLLYALLVVRFVIPVIPLVVLAAIYPRWRHYLWGLLNYVAAAVVAGTVLSVTAVAIIAAAGALLAPGSGVPWFLALLMLAAMSIAAWRLTKPLRHVRALSRRLPKLPKRKPKNRDESQDEAPPLLTPQSESEPYRRGRSATERFGPPAESKLRQFTATTVTGAIQGAATGAILAAFTGGTSVAAGAVAGGGQAAVSSAASATVIPRPAISSTPTGAPAPAPAPAIGSGYVPASSKPTTGAPTAPGGAGGGQGHRPGDHARVAPQASDGAYTISDLYTPTSSRRTDAGSTV